MHACKVAPSRDAGAPEDAAVIADAARLSDAGAHYHIELSRTSVSGISSGGFMAVQFQVAFSSIIKGAAIFAGGPDGCSQGSAGVAESTCTLGAPPISVSALVASTQTQASAGAIDATANLTPQRVFLFGGADDVVVNPLVMDALASYYAAFLPSTSILYVSRRPGTSHTWPTLSYGNACDVLASPYLGDCDYDGAGLALQQIYGPLAPPAANASGALWSLPAAQFTSNPASISVGDTAYAYVPASCAAGDTCAVHVAFHGCQQGASLVGDAFYTHAGLNEWADANHLIVIYPQAIATTANPEGCWDFWGYTGSNYAAKTAPQMAMVRAMIDWFASSVGGD